ncbi:MAG TPA: ROK family protein [Bryobacteraceae bacterium]|nr:ROK family protein [Bryobacteraceae bacterium]
MFGAIEAGGTKFICGVGTGPDDLETVRIPTTTPDETLGRCVEYFAERGVSIRSLGIGSFGPVDLKRGSPTWGYITSTPKAGWKDTDLAGRLSRGLGVPVGFDTDVNAAALAESRWGAAKGTGSCVYLTIGTGIGGGAVLDGQLLHGLVHPEMGHIRIPHDSTVDPFAGTCPFHGDCLEGLAAGPAIEARWGKPAAALPPNHPAWALEARYLALAVANFVFTLSPERVILGGGVMGQNFLFPMIRQELCAILNSYIQAPQVLHGMDDFVVPPGLGDRSGILGALALAERAIKR